MDVDDEDMSTKDDSDGAAEDGGEDTSDEDDRGKVRWNEEKGEVLGDGLLTIVLDGSVSLDSPELTEPTTESDGVSTIDVLSEPSSVSVSCAACVGDVRPPYTHPDPSGIEGP